MKRRSTSSDAPGARQRRLRVAAEAARLLAQGGGDPVVARRKAAARLGFDDPASLPSGEEIREALASHRRLFGGGGDDALLARRREAALDAMAHFAAFDPRLVGAVLDGSADADATIELHLHADDPDAVARLLLDRGAPATQRPRRLLLARGAPADVPCWELRADGLPFALWVLPATSARQPPLDPLDGTPMRRADARAVRRLLDQG